MSFTAAASGSPTPTVKWQVNDGTGWVDIPGATSTTLTFTTAAGDNGKKYRAVFHNVCSPNATTKAATLTVNTAPLVTTDPTNQTACAGSSVSFTAAASGSPAPTVQWQVNAGTGWSDIAGATSTTLTFTTAAGDNGKQYRAVFHNSCSPDATTAAATLTVNTAPVVTTSPTNQTVCAGSSVSFTAAASGSPAPTVQWQVNAGAGWSDIAGATSTTLTFTTAAGDNGKQYRAVFHNSCSPDATTTAATLTVNTAPLVTTDPTNQTACAGSSVSFTAAASGSPAPTVQWQVNAGAGWSDIAGATSTTLTFTTAAGDNGKQYRAVFHNSCSPDATTAAATLTVNTAPVVTTSPTNQTVCAGSSVSFTAAASGSPAPTVQWQVNAGAGWSDIAGATSTTLTFTTAAGDNGKQYRAVFHNSCSPDATTTAATLTVNTAPAITKNPSDFGVVVPAGATFKVVATGSPTPTVQWQVNTGSGWTNLVNAPPYSGVDTKTLLVKPTDLTMNGYQFRAVLTNICGTATTTAATLGIYSISFYDDTGRSQLCLDVASGRYRWAILKGTGSVSSYTGVLRVLNGGTLLTSATGDPNSIYLTYDVARHKANGYFYRGTISSQLVDSNTLDDPSGCN